MLKLQFLTCKKYSEERSTVKNCNFSKLQFFQCTSTVISLHIFAVWRWHACWNNFPKCVIDEDVTFAMEHKVIYIPSNINSD